jgi:hypothetical protein
MTAWRATFTKRPRLRVALAALSLAGCATGSGIDLADAARPANLPLEPPKTAQGEPLYLAASGNILLPWRDPAASGRPVSGGAAVDQIAGRATTAGGPLAGLDAALTPQPPGAALALSTPLAGAALQANLTPGATTAGLALTSPLPGLAAPLTAGQPLGGLGANRVGAGPGPLLVATPNPNAITGALLTDLTGALMQVSPPGATTAPVVPSSQNLGAVLGLLKRPGA